MVGTAQYLSPASVGTWTSGMPLFDESPTGMKVQITLNADTQLGNGRMWSNVNMIID